MRITRAIAEKRFIETAFYDAFEQDVPCLSGHYRNDSEYSDTALHYYCRLRNIASKLSKNDLLILANIVEGVDFDGISLNNPAHKGT